MKLFIAFSCFIIASHGCKPDKPTTTPRPTTKPTTARPPYEPTTASTTTTSTTTTPTTTIETRPPFISNTTKKPFIDDSPKRPFGNPNAINGNVEDLLGAEEEDIEITSASSKVQFPDDKERDPPIDESDTNKFVGGQTTGNGQEKICGSFVVFLSSVFLMMISS